MLRWVCKRFDALTLNELYDSLALRQRVFVLEQGPIWMPMALIVFVIT